MKAIIYVDHQTKVHIVFVQSKKKRKLTDFCSKKKHDSVYTLFLILCAYEFFRHSLIQCFISRTNDVWPDHSKITAYLKEEKNEVKSWFCLERERERERKWEGDEKQKNTKFMTHFLFHSVCYIWLIMCKRYGEEDGNNSRQLQYNPFVWNNKNILLDGNFMMV